jgi:hypothetical protein
MRDVFADNSVTRGNFVPSHPKVLRLGLPTFQFCQQHVQVEFKISLGPELGHVTAFVMRGRMFPKLHMEIAGNGLIAKARLTQK